MVSAVSLASDTNARMYGVQQAHLGVDIANADAWGGLIGIFIRLWEVKCPRADSNGRHKV